MIGTLVAGRYYIEAQIGIGGMGVVYRARDERLKRDVALKVIAPHLMQQEAARARFLREAQALAGLTHPNIVTIYDMADDADTQLVFLVMELLAGRSLRQYMTDGVCPRTPDCPPFSRIASALCRALEAAHKRGVLHRDIKPENVFVCEDGTLKLMDFGLARLLGDVSKNQSSTVAGTIAYMAPEQLRGEALDVRADLYALGVVFFEFIAGHLPFVADNPGAVLLKHLSEPPPHLHDTLPEMPPAMDDLVTRLLAKEPGARFASVSEVRQALEQMTEGGALAVRVDEVIAGIAESGRRSVLFALTVDRGASDSANITEVNGAVQDSALSAPAAANQTQSAVAAQVQAALTQEADLSTGSAAPVTASASLSAVPVSAPANTTDRRASRRAPIYVGLTALGVASVLLIGKAWPHRNTQGVVTPPRKIMKQAMPNTQAAVAPSPAAVSSAQGGAKLFLNAPALLTAKANPSAIKGAGMDKQGANTENAKAGSPASGRVVQESASPSGTIPPPLSNSERAELETLRKEQQEELSLLRSLKRQVGDKSAQAAKTPAASPIVAPVTPSGKSALTSAASQKMEPVSHRAAPGRRSSPPDTEFNPPAPPPNSPNLTSAKPLSAGGTSEFEETRPQTPLQVRVWRRAASDDKRAIHINLRNNANCYAYFYIVEVDKRRAVRAYPGPEQFLTPQTRTPQELRLPLPEGMDNNLKSVLVIAAPQEITGLPSLLSLPPAPADMPQSGAAPQQMRQALHRYNDQLAMQLQQSHAHIGGQPLHPHDVIIHMTGMRPPPANRIPRDASDSAPRS